jgi:hypothetical protein
MPKDITVHYSYSELKIGLGIADRDFFKQFSNLKEVVRSSDGRSVPKGDVGNYLIFAGSAVLSSATFAAAVKAWIEGRRRKIVVTVGDKKIEYEGPNLSRDIKEIEGMMDKLAEEDPRGSLLVRAVEMSEVD